MGKIIKKNGEIVFMKRQYTQYVYDIYRFTGLFKTKHVRIYSHLKQTFYVQ